MINQEKKKTRLDEKNLDPFILIMSYKELKR